MIDERTQKYFDAIKKNIGFQGYNASWYTIKEILEKNGNLETAQLEQIKIYQGYVNSSDITIYTYLHDGERRYCAELSYQTAIDDYCTETLIFNRCPSRDDVLLIRKIHDFEFKFRFKRLKPEFTCWECGRFVHWLDNEKSFNEKVEMLEEKYCGC